jgi:hypothetical protein
MAIHLKHVLKLAEILFDSGARLVMLRGFHCSQRRDVRTAGMDFNANLSFDCHEVREIRDYHSQVGV